MNTSVRRSSRQKASRAKPTSTYLGPEDDRDFEFVIACSMEKLRLNGEQDPEPITKAEMLRILIAEKAESLRAEGWKDEQFGQAR